MNHLCWLFTDRRYDLISFICERSHHSEWSMHFGQRGVSKTLFVSTFIWHMCVYRCQHLIGRFISCAVKTYQVRFLKELSVLFLNASSILSFFFILLVLRYLSRTGPRPLACRLLISSTILLFPVGWNWAIIHVSCFTLTLQSAPRSSRKGSLEVARLAVHCDLKKGTGWWRLLQHL